MWSQEFHNEILPHSKCFQGNLFESQLKSCSSLFPFQVSKEKFIKLEFQKFAVGNQNENCIHDYLEVEDERWDWWRFPVLQFFSTWFTSDAPDSGVLVSSRGAQMSDRVGFGGAGIDSSYFADVSFQKLVSAPRAAAVFCVLDLLQWRGGARRSVKPCGDDSPQSSSVCFQILWQEVKKRIHHHQKQQGHRDVSLRLLERRPRIPHQIRSFLSVWP